MKTILSILCLCAVLSSCTSYDTKGSVKSGEAEYKINVIDNCEYLFKAYSHGCMFSHKGNCSNPVHKCENGGIYSN